MENNNSNQSTLLNQPVEIIELSIRAANCLKNAKVRTIRDLVLKTREELLACKDFGRRSLAEIECKLKELGLSLGMQVSEVGEAIESVKKTEESQGRESISVTPEEPAFFMFFVKEQSSGQVANVFWNCLKKDLQENDFFSFTEKIVIPQVKNILKSYKTIGVINIMYFSEKEIKGVCCAEESDEAKTERLLKIKEMMQKDGANAYIMVREVTTKSVVPSEHLRSNMLEIFAITRDISRVWIIPFKRTGESIVFEKESALNVIRTFGGLIMNLLPDSDSDKGLIKE